MRQIFLAAILVTLAGLEASAQGLQAVRPLPGYTCMQVANPPAPTLDPTQGVPVRNIPSLSAPVASWAPSVVLVTFPLETRAGFLQALFADKHTGWILASDLKPWSNPYNLRRRCVPSIMSNGTVGFDMH